MELERNRHSSAPSEGGTLDRQSFENLFNKLRRRKRTAARQRGSSGKRKTFNMPGQLGAALLVICGLALLSIGPTPSRALNNESSEPAVALVHVALRTHDDLVRFQGTGIPAYARLRGEGGDYLLVGATTADVAVLKAADLSIRILDSDVTGTTYYLNYDSSAQSHLGQAASGQLLLDDGIRELLRLPPREAEQLIEAGVALNALALKPRPLRPIFAPQVISAVSEPDPFVQSLIDQVSSDTVYQYVGDLSGEWPVDIGGLPFTIATRYTYSGIYIHKATQYVGDHLAALGLDVEYHVWDRAKYPNIIGELRGESTPEDIYIICAHLDDAPFEGVAPGADDNASGSAAVLIAADILSQHRWNSTLRFILFTGEEQWSMDEYYAHGSFPYAQRSRERGENIVGVLNLDMLGWNSEGKPEPALDLLANSSHILSPSLELAQLFVDVVETYDLNLEPDIIPDRSGLGDHGSFWDHGYVAIMGIEDLLDFNPFYHTSSDRLTFLDLDYLTEFIKAGVGTLAHMSSRTMPPIQLYLPTIVHNADAQ